MSDAVWHAVVLGALQGITEFLPVSSSAHLIVIPEVLGWPPASLTFDVAVHLATALAVFLYFRAEWTAMLSGLWTGVRHTRSLRSPEIRMLALVALATIPAALVGWLVQGTFETTLADDPRFAASLSAVLLLVTGGLLLLSERLGRKALTAESIRPRGALGVGLAQAVAILPGISRSGATIAAGLAGGLRRDEAARFSFLLAGPIILGASFLQGADAIHTRLPPGEAAAIVAGSLTALVVGYVTIGWFLRYLRRAPLYLFVAYTWLAGLAFLWWLR